MYRMKIKFKCLEMHNKGKNNLKNQTRKRVSPLSHGMPNLYRQTFAYILFILRNSAETRNKTQIPVQLLIKIEINCKTVLESYLPLKGRAQNVKGHLILKL